MKTLKEILEGWVERYQNNLIAGAIDIVKFSAMNQKEINHFFEERTSKAKILKRTYRRMNEDKDSLEKAKLILQKYNEQQTGDVIEFIQRILPEAFESRGIIQSAKRVSGRNDFGKTVKGRGDDRSSGIQDGGGQGAGN